ncbi:alpha/beta hydrolase [Microbacterium sp. P01]|uniref:alpha/beta hydrolase n=1 Tax=unclassified Microbacterium TaxID=2609290 RepID=UPI00367355BF
MAGEWVADILGAPFEQQTLPLGEDFEGEVVATIVRSQAHRHVLHHQPLADVDVLYVHGWSDYFFQREFATFWTDRGADFYALDLRKYGRSLRPGQTPGYIADLTTYDEDISAALEAMNRPLAGEPAKRRLVLVGHSTGGLILSLWAARHPRLISAVVLNSPWLEFQLSGTTRAAVSPLLSLETRLRPMETIPQVDLGYYARAQREVRNAEDPLDVNLEWRPEQSMAVHAGWLHAVLVGHARVASGLAIDAPVCVLLSAKSAIPRRWSEDLTRSDSVLVVDDIARASLKLASSVTVDRIAGALHDVFLSRADVRDEAYYRLERWVIGCLATRAPVAPRPRFR